MWFQLQTRPPDPGSEKRHDVIITSSVLEEPRYFDIRATSALLSAAATVPCRRYPVRWRCCCYNNTSSVPPQQHTSRHSRDLCHGQLFSTHGPCRDHHSCHLNSSVAAAVKHCQIISDSLLNFQRHLIYFIIFMLTSCWHLFLSQHSSWVVMFNCCSVDLIIILWCHVWFVSDLRCVRSDCHHERCVPLQLDPNCFQQCPGCSSWWWVKDGSSHRVHTAASNQPWRWRGWCCFSGKFHVFLFYQNFMFSYSINPRIKILPVP